MAESKNYIENVAVVGAGGHLGKFITEALLKTGKHTVSAITRASSTSIIPDDVHVIKVDYNDKSSLVEALRGQDALVITIGLEADDSQQTKLIEAAAEANVPWIMPNEWSHDMGNDSLRKDIPGGESKKEARDLVTRLGKSSFIALTTGSWYEHSMALPFGLGFGIDFANHSVTLYDEGNTPVTTSTWPQIARAVSGLFSLKIRHDGDGDGDDSSQYLDKYRNKLVYMSSFSITQNDMFQSVLRTTDTKAEDWTVRKQQVTERFADAVQQLQKGNRMAFVQLIYSRWFFDDDAGNFVKTRPLLNGTLGLPEEDIDEATKAAIGLAREMAKNTHREI